MTDMRTAFAAEATALLDEDPLAAVVLAEISTELFAKAAARHPERVLNVGIREQLMVSVGGGLALAGLRPIVHSYASFLVERAFEQVKLDLAHQGTRAVLVSVGASYDAARAGRTHQAPEDVALLDTVPGFAVQVPGHPDEVPGLLRGAVAALGDAGASSGLGHGAPGHGAPGHGAPEYGAPGHGAPEYGARGHGAPGRDGPLGAGSEGYSSYIRLSTAANRDALALSPGLQVVRPGSQAVVVAVGPMLDPVLCAVAGLDVTVAYATTVRPFDAAGLRSLAGGAASGAVVLVEPYLAGTSAHVVSEALAGRAHRLLSLGVPRAELRRYGTPADHAALLGLDGAGIRRAVTEFLGMTSMDQTRW
jgi:transketolase